MSTVVDFNNPFAALAAKMPAVQLTLPPAWFFRFPPAPFPRSLPSPPDHPALAHPFTIPGNVYNAMLDGMVPFTVAIVYITTITFLNSLNKSRNYEPWAFSKTRLFKLLVISHNIILAVYSAWTFVGMFNALRRSVYNPYHEWGFAGTVDSFCKLNGPRGFGSAAVYNERNAAWGIANRFFHLGADGLAPDTADVGRIWNEGLAFYGWLFYLSKFYEVIDTLIIIAKGKKSSFLQTYHHAGAMICMWAGIRYMSPPIWMFVLVNSFIHSIMYSFYLCTALGIRIPVWFKRTLTTLQITQFVVGAIYAFIHLFIQYESPYSIATHHTPGSPVEDIVSDISSVVSTATATVTANLSAHIKKALLRAAGREGLAENVLNEQGRTFGADTENAAKDFYKRQITEYRDDLHYVHCLDTSGQAFAIYLNVLYLLPLTMLFVRFFIKSYLRRLERRRSSTTAPVPIERRAHDLRESFSDATKGARRSVLSLGGPQEGDEDTDNAIDDTDFDEQKQEVKQEIQKASRQAWRDMNESANRASKSVSRQVNQAKANTGPAIQNAKENVERAAASTSQTIKNASKQVKETVSESNEGMQNTLENLKQQADSVKAQSEPILQEGREKAEGAYESVKTSVAATKEKYLGDASISDVTDTTQIKEAAENLKEKASDGAHQGIGVLQNSAESISQSVQNTASSVKESVGSQVESAKAKADELTSAVDSKSSQSQSRQKPTSNARKSKEASESEDSAKTDKDVEKTQSTEQESEKEVGSSDKQVEQDSSKEQVRHSDPQEGSQTESSTGDAQEATKSTVDSESQGTQPKDVATTKKSNKKDLDVKNSNDKEYAGKDVSGKESASKEPNSKEAVEKKDPTEDTDAIEEKSGGRQSFFKNERAEALEKLKSANSEGDDKVIPDDDQVEANKQDTDEKTKQKAQSSKSNEENSRGNHGAFEETRLNALEKLKSVNSESQDDKEGESHPLDQSNQKPSRRAKEAAAEELADADHSQDFEDQKESWIDVGNEHASERTKSKSETTDASKAGTGQPSFAEIVKSDVKEQAEDADEDKPASGERKRVEQTDKTAKKQSERQTPSAQAKQTGAGSNKQETESTEVKVEGEEKSAKQTTSEPEWFERLTASTDGHQKSNESLRSEPKEDEGSAAVVQGVSFADKLKENAGTEDPKPAADGDHGFGIFDDMNKSKDDTPDAKQESDTVESKADKQEKAEQDKIIAESEPVRDEVKEPSKKDDTEAVDIPASPRWHRRRKG